MSAVMIDTPLLILRDFLVCVGSATVFYILMRATIWVVDKIFNEPPHL